MHTSVQGSTEQVLPELWLPLGGGATWRAGVGGGGLPVLRKGENSLRVEIPDIIF